MRPTPYPRKSAAVLLNMGLRQIHPFSAESALQARELLLTTLASMTAPLAVRAFQLQCAPVQMAQQLRANFLESTPPRIASAADIGLL